MNPAALLLTPWWASHRVMRWMAAMVFFVAMLGAAAVLVFQPGPRGQIVAIGVYAGGVVFLGAFFFSAIALLAIDARQLRLPAAERSATLGLLLYAVLVVALPAIVAAALHGPVMLAASFAAAALAAGLAFALLPGYVAMVAGFTPAMMSAIGHTLHFPVWTPQRLLLAASGVLVLGVLAVLVQWPRLLRGSGSGAPGLNRCMVLQLRHGGLTRWSGSRAETHRALQRPAWAQPEVDIRATGPQRPVTTLRVALGGWYVPQTLHGWLRQIRNQGAILLLVLGFMAITQLDHPGRSLDLALVRFALVGFACTLVIMITIGMPLITAAALHRRWSAASGELPLLALLPGLGQDGSLRRPLLRAALTRPLTMHALALLATLIGVLAFHLGPISSACLLTCQLCAALATVSVTLCTLGDREPAPWLQAMLVIAFTTLVSIAGFVTMVSHRWVDEGNWPHAGAVEGAFALGFVLLGVTLLWLARRGWRGMQAKPHPFSPLTAR